MRKKLAVRVEKAIHEKVFPGCVVGFVQEGGEQTVLPFGTLTYAKDAPEVREDTIYDVASITKSIPTASLALSLIDEGKIGLNDLVRTHIPELRNDHGATIEDLLTYRVAGVQLSTLKDTSAEEILEYVFAHGFEGPPGESRYTNLPASLLGIIVERIGGEPIDVLAKKYFFDPLNMNNTTFFPTNDGPRRSIIAPTEVESSGEIRGIVHDESARVFAKVGRTVGHAGLFSTVPDLLNFLGTLLAGQYSYIVEGAQKGLGWQLNDTNFMAQHAGPHTFGKTGFTGTSIVCDVEHGIGLTILSNRTYPKRPPNDDAIFALRRDVADILLS